MSQDGGQVLTKARYEAAGISDPLCQDHCLQEDATKPDPDPAFVWTPAQGALHLLSVTALKLYLDRTCGSRQMVCTEVSVLYSQQVNLSSTTT